MLFRGDASGHDFLFHLASWMDAAGQWREGIAYPRWAEWANWGFGEPRFVFYPPASWMIGAALGSVLPWRMVPGTFIWLALTAAGMSMWKLAREWLPGWQAGLAAVLYTVSPYHLVIVYYRSAFAELLACALLPLLLWGALHVAREEWRRVPLLAIVFAGIWLSNGPAAVIATYSLCLALIVECAVRRSPRPLVPGATAMAAGFGLAAFYILPAAWEQCWVQIAQAVSENLRPARNFLFTSANDPQFVLFNWKVSAVALGVMGVTGIAAVFAARRRRDFSDLWWLLAALGAASIALMLRPSILLWQHLPEMQFVQFPWRWLDVLDASFAFFVAAAIGRSTGRWVRWIAIVMVGAAIGAAAAAMIHDAWWDTQGAPALTNAIRSARGYEGTDEYMPNDCDRSELPGNPDDTSRMPDASATPASAIEKLDPSSGQIVPANSAGIHIERWTAERKSFTEESAEPVTLALRLLSYPAWGVRVDAVSARFDVQSVTARLLLPLPRGTHRVEVRFRRTWDRTAGNAISALTAAALLAFAWAFRKRRRTLKSGMGQRD
jgi:6-pyruvoyl-tetrahydropterin synthase related domain